MKNKIILIIIILLLLSGTVYLVNAQDPGRFCLSKYGCVGDCDDGVIRPFIQTIPENEAACEVDVYFPEGNILPFFEDECKFGVCVFGIPFGPVKVFSYPTSDDIVRITVKVNDREFSWLSVLFKNYTPPKLLSVDPYPPPYPYP